VAANTFGDFTEPDSNVREYLIIGFSPSSVPIRRRWRNNSLSADFMADYVTTFFPAEDSTDQHQCAEIKDAVSYIANELLENAMKFSVDATKYPVDIQLYLHQKELRFYVSNTSDTLTARNLQSLIQELLTGNTEELYFQRIEAHATTGEGDTSAHVGFLTMLNNYNAQLAWRFEQAEDGPANVTVTTMVRLNTQAPLQAPPN
jgi:hypothetical protein